MKIKERLNETMYLATREGLSWNYRLIVTSETNLEVGKSYSRQDGIEMNVKSLCEATAILFFGSYNDHGDYDDLKESALEVWRGETTLEEAKEWCNI